eukprot:1143836-Pelagomonas_calceolata.AAC.3
MPEACQQKAFCFCTPVVLSLPSDDPTAWEHESWASKERGGGATAFPVRYNAEMMPATLYF